MRFFVAAVCSKNACIFIFIEISGFFGSSFDCVDVEQHFFDVAMMELHGKEAAKLFNVNSLKNNVEKGGRQVGWMASGIVTLVKVFHSNIFCNLGSDLKSSFDLFLCGSLVSIVSTTAIHFR